MAVELLRGMHTFRVRVGLSPHSAQLPVVPGEAAGEGARPWAPAARVETWTDLAAQPWLW